MIQINNEFEGKYLLNLIDTPGHSDFSFEVEKTLLACEGALLLIDATKGVQAQTLANFQKAKSFGMTVLPVINKIGNYFSRYFSEFLTLQIFFT